MRRAGPQGATAAEIYPRLPIKGHDLAQAVPGQQPLRHAAELIHIGQAVMQLDGDLTYFIRSVFNYPTLAEAYKTAAFNAYNQILGR